MKPTVAPSELSRRGVLEAGVVAAGLAAGGVPKAVWAAEGGTGVTAVPLALRINGRTYSGSLDPRTTLLDLLREHLLLTGSKKGCDHGQ